MAEDSTVLLVLASGRPAPSPASRSPAPAAGRRRTQPPGLLCVSVITQCWIAVERMQRNNAEAYTRADSPSGCMIVLARSQHEHGQRPRPDPTGRGQGELPRGGGGADRTGDPRGDVPTGTDVVALAGLHRGCPPGVVDPGPRRHLGRATAPDRRRDDDEMGRPTPRNEGGRVRSLTKEPCCTFCALEAI